MVLYFVLRARYSVSPEYGAEFRTQSSIFDTQTNVELNFDFRARYSVPTEYCTEFRSQGSKFGTQSNVELNFHHENMPI